MQSFESFSYWEKDVYFNHIDVLIIGAGLVGLQTAIELKEKNGALKIMVVDRNFIPLGASTRNAGFACFGSPSEILDDLKHRNERDVFSLFAMRYHGIQLLKKRIGTYDVEWNQSGGYECVHPDYSTIIPEEQQIHYLNSQIEQQTSLPDFFKIEDNKKNSSLLHGSSMIVYNKEEATLHPVKLWEALYLQAKQVGIFFMFSLTLERWDENEKGVIAYFTNHISFACKKMIFCVNGFAKKLLPGLDVIPARNQVLVLKAATPFQHKACFHVNCGYIYFRSVHGKLLIGGARHIAMEEEYSDSWIMNNKIKEYLITFAGQTILKGQSFTIESHWLGIMGLGSAKIPIIQMVSDSIGVAVRMGGMGVALSSVVAKDAAQMIYEKI